MSESDYSQRVKDMLSNNCDGKGNCIKNTIMNIPKGNSMHILRNKGDGHCFYHTVLRFINDHQKYFNSVKLGNGENVSSLLPGDYNPENQKSKDIYMLRKALIDNYRDRYKSRPKEGTRKGIENAFYEKALNHAKLGLGTRNWAGNGDLSEQEFTDMALLLKACIIIWQKNEYTRKWQWSIFNSEEGGKFINNCGTDDPDISSKKCCPVILFGYNSGGVHFDTLIPKVISSKVKKKTTISKSRSNKKSSNKKSSNIGIASRTRSAINKKRGR
jgi:hypothetical protein